MAVNHFRRDGGNTLLGMGDKNLTRVLWDNVRSLMISNWGAENLNRLAREAKIGPASATRD